MSGFQFPPPPPPPPRTNQQGQQPYSGRPERSQNRGRGRGGGFRGGHRNNADAFARDQRDLPVHGNAGRSIGNRYDHSESDDWKRQSQPSSNGPVIPPGSYVNPAFNFGQHNLNNGSAISGPRQDHSGYTSHPSTASTPPRTAAGHKRKLEALRTTIPQKQSGPPIAPSVPTFGTPILSNAPSTTSGGPRNDSKAPRRAEQKPNALGLTPATDDPHYSSSEHEAEEDDVDEEAMYAELGTKLTFEYNGNVVSLKSPAELAQWKTERLKNFPTKNRMLARLDEKRRVGETRKKLLNQAAAALWSFKQDPSKGDITGEVSQSGTQLRSSEHGVMQLNTTTNDLKDVRKDVQAMSSTPPSPSLRPATVDDETGPGAGAASDAIAPSHLGRSGKVANAEHTEWNPDGATDTRGVGDDGNDQIEASDDSSPEELTTKAPDLVTKPSQMLCRYFSTRGSCRNGSECHFRHEIASVDRPSTHGDRARKDVNPRAHQAAASTATTISGRKGIHQALIEQQEEDRDRLALEVIKHLGRVGFFDREN